MHELYDQMIRRVAIISDDIKYVSKLIVVVPPETMDVIVSIEEFLLFIAGKKNVYSETKLVFMELMLIIFVVHGFSLGALLHRWVSVVITGKSYVAGISMWCDH